MNTFLLTYSLQGGEPQDLLRAIGRSARLAAKDKKFTYEQGRTVGDYVQISGEWDTLLGDLRSALRLNLYGLLLVNVRVRLNNTFVPDVSPSFAGYRTFREGEKRLELYYDVEKEIAELHNNARDYRWDGAYEKFMLDTVSRVQAVSRAGKAAKTLIMAYRATDRRYIDRATKQLFEDIGGTL